MSQTTDTLSAHIEETVSLVRQQLKAWEWFPEGEAWVRNEAADNIPRWVKRKGSPTRIELDLLALITVGHYRMEFAADIAAGWIIAERKAYIDEKPVEIPLEAKKLLVDSIKAGIQQAESIINARLEKVRPSVDEMLDYLAAESRGDTTPTQTTRAAFSAGVKVLVDYLFELAGEVDVPRLDLLRDDPEGHLFPEGDIRLVMNIQDSHFATFLAAVMWERGLKLSVEHFIRNRVALVSARLYQDTGQLLITKDLERENRPRLVANEAGVRFDQAAILDWNQKAYQALSPSNLWIRGRLFQYLFLKSHELYRNSATAVDSLNPSAGTYMSVIFEGGDGNGADYQLLKAISPFEGKNPRWAALKELNNFLDVLADSRIEGLPAGFETKWIHIERVRAAPGRESVLEITLAGPFRPASYRRLKGSYRTALPVPQMLTPEQHSTRTNERAEEVSLWVWSLPILFNLKRDEAYQTGFVTIDDRAMKVIRTYTNLDAIQIRRCLENWVSCKVLLTDGVNGFRYADDLCWEEVMKSGKISQDKRKAGIASANARAKGIAPEPKKKRGRPRKY
jgi:hypothetical protein